MLVQLHAHVWNSWQLKLGGLRRGHSLSEVLASGGVGPLSDKFGSTTLWNINRILIKYVLNRAGGGLVVVRCINRRASLGRLSPDIITVTRGVQVMLGHMNPGGIFSGSRPNQWHGQGCVVDG